MTQTNKVLQLFLERLGREIGCSTKAAARTLLEHEWREVQNRHEVYPQIGTALRSNPIDFGTLKNLLVKSKESPTGGHGSMRVHVGAFLDSEEATPLIRLLIPTSDEPPDETAIASFVEQASNVAFFTYGKSGKSYQAAESALFASVLLSAAFPDLFVDFRADRWNWAASTLGLTSFSPATNNWYSSELMHAGVIARELANAVTFQKCFAKPPDLWTAAGFVFLLCKEDHFRELAEVANCATVLPPVTSALKRAFASFKDDPEHRFIVKLRQARASTLRKLMSTPDAIDLPTFNKEVWDYCSSAKIGEKEFSKKLNFGNPLPPADLSQLSNALESGTLELHGNCMWGSGSRVYGPKGAGDDDTKLQNIRKALSILNENKKKGPFAKAEQLQGIAGFGPNSATGLCMVFFPENVAIYNEKSTGGLRIIGQPFTDHKSFQKAARHLKYGLNADNYIQLDWFLFLVCSGRIVLHEKPQRVSTHPNLILHGPPGTGKTYSTMQRAVAICDGEASSDRDELRTRYQALRDVGRIVFVTFHQSYGYEEFVEGIRPVLFDGESDAGSSQTAVRYECRDGLFKRLCSLAKGKLSTPKQEYNFDQGDIRVWKMSLGDTNDPQEAGIFDECIENGYALLGYGRGLDFGDCETRDAIKKKLQTHDSNIQNNDYNITSVNIFRNEMNTGDLVVVSEGNHKFRAIGKITGDYEYVGEGEYVQRRSVDWLVVYEESLPVESLLRKQFSQATLYRLWPNVLKMESIKELLSDDDKDVLENHVIIIDEINRGNISKILGELITLLEPDKRLGADNELVVKLPYSGEEFGVPANVYVLGTMNTADRSIAFLDTALRRRFRFEEVMPQSTVISEHVGDGGKIGPVDVGRLLEVLNERIEKLYDRDHQLGHSFFLKVKSLADLRDVFLANVLPLLHEYFYGDWDKICKVLGCPYNGDTGKATMKNDAPILLASSFKTEGFDDEDEDGRLRVCENPSFLDAPDQQLAPYFLGILGKLNGSVATEGSET